MTAENHPHTTHMEPENTLEQLVIYVWQHMEEPWHVTTHIVQHA